jgi:hypothetical protein
MAPQPSFDREGLMKIQGGSARLRACKPEPRPAKPFMHPSLDLHHPSDHAPPHTPRLPENSVRTATILPCCLVLTVITTGCGDNNRSAAPAPAADNTSQAPAASAAPMSAPSTEPYSEGGTMKPFYGEVFHEGRFYLFGTKGEFTKFLDSHSSNPLISKSFIAKGPNRETVICEKPKDSPSMASRLINQFRKRHNLPPVE